MNTCTNITGPECCDETSESQESADNSEHESSDETDESKNSESYETTQTPQDPERRPMETQRANRAPYCKVQIRVIDMKQDTKQLITQPKRNNSFRKKLDTFMVAETEDLIIEYCRTIENITNMCVKEGEGGSPYDRIGKRHFEKISGLKTKDTQELFQNSENNL